jgi:hypothetical protein
MCRFSYSFFKAFNISVFDTSPNNEDLFWLTPSDIETEGQTYSKAVLDYTPYVDISTYKRAYLVILITTISSTPQKV